MRLTQKRAFGCLFGLVIGASAASACSDLSDVEREQCGNRVVEEDEECDTYESLASSDSDRPSLCAGPTDPNACHYVWDSDHLCPTGWKPGQDNRCRQPSGELGVALGPLPALKGRRPQVADIDLDGQLDVMVDSPDGLATVAFYLAESADGFVATVGTVAGSNASLVDLTGDGFADVASTVELSTGDEGLSGIVVQRGNADRVDEPRLYPGPTRFPGEVIIEMVPRVDAVPGSVLDLDFAYAVFRDPEASCGGNVCYQREYFASPEPFPLLADAFVTGEQFVTASTSSNRSFSVLAIPGFPGHFGHSSEAPPEAVFGGGPGFMATSVGGITAFPGNSDVGAVMRSADKWLFAFLPGKIDPKTDWFPAVMASVDALDAERGPAFGFINGDDIVDVVISGASPSDLTAPWKWGGVMVSHTTPSGGDLFDSHVVAAGAAVEGANLGAPRWVRHTIGDFNGDGFDDVAAGYEAGTTPGIAIVLGGNLLPLASSESATDLTVTAIAATDFDGDGLDDIVIAVGDGLAKHSCDVGDEIRVAYGRTSGFPEAFVPVGRVPGVTHLVPGRFELPPDGAGDVGIASSCVLSDGSREHRTTIVHGSSARRPFAPFILAPGVHPRRVLGAVVDGQVVLTVSGPMGYTMIPVTGDADLSGALDVPGIPFIEPLAMMTAPAIGDGVVLASLTNGFLRLDALATVPDGVAPAGAPSLLFEVPSGSLRSPHWSLAALPAHDEEAAALAAIALQEVDDQDGDGTADVFDNCLVVPNLDQGDLDEDLLGDACDDDADGDGWANAEDNCPKTSNDQQEDVDGDLLGDACDKDADNDGLSNGDETLLGLDPLSSDTDGDSLSDGVEVGDPELPQNADLDEQIDALDLDSDDDGLLDSFEAGGTPFPRDRDLDGTPDYRDEDSDDDGVPDGPPGPLTDNCRLIANAGQADADSDFVGDACEDLPDADFDAVPDVLDNCPVVQNVDQSDIDGDLVGDACSNDSDGDGIENAVDNCPSLPAKDQGDLDADTHGDLCDLDDDADDVIDVQDNCPTQPNTDQLDGDGDGLGDACDDVTTVPEASRYSVFALLPWAADGELGEPLFVSLPEGSSEFVDVVSFEGLDLERWLFVATDAGVFRVLCRSEEGSLPRCEGHEPLLEDAGLTLNHLTGLASGDFTGDGLDDLLVIDDDGARVVPQLAL